MAPSYIAVLNVYAVHFVQLFFRHRSFSSPLQFANVRDMSWGTKGDNKVSTDLGVVSVGKGSNKNEVEIAIIEEKDINAAYEDATDLLSMKRPKAAQTVVLDLTMKQQDFYKTFQTNMSHRLSGSWLINDP